MQYEHIVQLNSLARINLVNFALKPNGSLRVDDRLTLEAVEGRGLLVRTKAGDHDHLVPTAKREEKAAYWNERLKEMLEDRFADGTPVLEYVLANNPDLRYRLDQQLRAGFRSAVVMHHGE